MKKQQEDNINEQNGWTRRANTTIAKIRKAEVVGKVANYEQKVLTGSPEQVREQITKNSPNSKLDVEYAHNIQVFEKEELKALTHGVIKSHHVAVIQSDSVGDDSNSAPIESYDNTNQAQSQPTWMKENGLDNAETGEKGNPLTKEGFFLKNMWDKAQDWMRSHEEKHTLEELEEKGHRTTMWLVIGAIGVISVAALVGMLL